MQNVPKRALRGAITGAVAGVAVFLYAAFGIEIAPELQAALITLLVGGADAALPRSM